MYCKKCGSPNDNDAVYCKKCGSPNDNDAVYCKKCGTLLEVEDETRVVRRESAAGHLTEVYRTGPTLKFVMMGYIVAALAAIVLVGLLALTGIRPGIGVIIGLSMLLVPAYFHLQQKLLRYSLDDQCIEIDSGLVSRTTRNIPLTRIQDVTVSASAFQRLLNLGDVVIDNASENGGKLTIRNIDSPREYADKLLRHIRRLDR